MKNFMQINFLHYEFTKDVSKSRAHKQIDDQFSRF